MVARRGGGSAGEALTKEGGKGRTDARRATCATTEANSMVLVMSVGWLGVVCTHL